MKLILALLLVICAPGVAYALDEVAPTEPPTEVVAEPTPDIIPEATPEPVVEETPAPQNWDAAAAEFIASETSAFSSWVSRHLPGASLEEAASRWSAAAASGWDDSLYDPLTVPWGICAPDWLAGYDLPSFISERIVGYGSGPDCE